MGHHTKTNPNDAMYLDEAIWLSLFWYFLHIFDTACYVMKTRISNNITQKRPQFIANHIWWWTMNCPSPVCSFWKRRRVLVPVRCSDAVVIDTTLPQWIERLSAMSLLLLLLSMRERTNGALVLGWNMSMKQFMCVCSFVRSMVVIESRSINGNMITWIPIWKCVQCVYVG